MRVVDYTTGKLALLLRWPSSYLIGLLPKGKLIHKR